MILVKLTCAAFLVLSVEATVFGQMRNLEFRCLTDHSEKFLGIIRKGNRADRAASITVFQLQSESTILNRVHDATLLDRVDPGFPYLSPNGRFLVVLNPWDLKGKSPPAITIYDLQQNEYKVLRGDEFLCVAERYKGDDGFQSNWFGYKPSFDRRSSQFFPTAPAESASGKWPFVVVDLMNGSASVQPIDSIDYSDLIFDRNSSAWFAHLASIHDGEKLLPARIQKVPRKGISSIYQVDTTRRPVEPIEESQEMADLDTAESPDKCLVVVSGFGRMGNYDGMYGAHADNPSYTFGEMLVAQLARHHIDHEFVGPIPLEWGSFEKLLAYECGLHRPRRIIWIALSHGARGFRLETVADNQRNSAIIDAENSVAGREGVPSLNDSQASVDAQEACLIPMAGRARLCDELARFQFKESRDAGNHVSESAAYALYRAVRLEQLKCGMFISTPDKLTAAESAEVAAALIQSLFDDAGNLKPDLAAP